MKVSSPKASLRIPETLALDGAILALEQVSHDLVIWSNLSYISFGNFRADVLLLNCSVNMW